MPMVIFGELFLRLAFMGWMTVGVVRMDNGICRVQHAEGEGSTT